MQYDNLITDLYDLTEPRLHYTYNPTRLLWKAYYCGICIITRRAEEITAAQLYTEAHNWVREADYTLQRER